MKLRIDNLTSTFCERYDLFLIACLSRKNNAAFTIKNQYKSRKFRNFVVKIRYRLELVQVHTYKMKRVSSLEQLRLAV